MKHALSISDLTFAYPGDTFRLAVSELKVAAGATLALAGASGGGKTTLLRLMTGLLAPSSGIVELEGQNLSQMSREALRALRLRHIGLVFQDFALLDYLTVEENILLPHQFSRETLAKASSNLPALIERLQIATHRTKLVSQLSQGERQRVAIARALAHEPRFLFADEPTASLDPLRTQVVTDLLIEDAKTRQSTLVVVTHDHDLLPRFDETQRMDAFTR
ncbi:MAG: ATP-binding cassette domain-containing protein [Verrucomicrobiaceae bacterium]|nr:ATP-binding cassette domain-containing protein [Verrucomicrobiaceae bacterium]